LLPVRDGRRAAAAVALDNALQNPAGAEAAVFLAHALLQSEFRFFQRLAAEEGGEDYGTSAEAYANVRMIAFTMAFPLDDLGGRRLAQVDHAFEVFEDSDGYRSRYPTLPGVPLFLPLTTALELHGLADDDEERLATLVGTRRTCSWYFTDAAIVHALQITAGDGQFERDFARDLTVGELGDFETIVAREDV
jgi:hypothetical protein